MLKLKLQLFAEDGNAGGAAQAAAGGAQPDAGGAAGSEGVIAQPQRDGSRAKIFPRVQRVETASARPVRSEPMRVPSAQQQTQQQPQAPQMTWADAKKQFSKEYGDDVRAAVNDRFKNHQDQSAKLNKAMETLAAIAPFYGMDASDPEAMDLEKLSKSITDDKRWYEKSALEKGIPVETEMHYQQLEREKARNDAEKRKSLEQEMLAKHLEGLRQQETEFKAEFPDFDLMAEIQANPAFARMTSPGGGLTVRQAYMALHGDEMMQRVSQASSAKAQENMSRAIQSGAMRPQENGMAAAGGGVPANSYAAMTREQRRQMRRDAAAGKAFYIGG